MSIEIEILDMSDGNVSAAYYYVIEGDQILPGANDQDREPTGTRLSPDEVQALKDGTLYEWVITRVRPAGTFKDLQQFLIQDRSQNNQVARAYYAEQYGGVGLAYDGNSWS